MTSPGSGPDQQYQCVNFHDAYRPRTPEAIIGNSIYVLVLVCDDYEGVFVATKEHQA